MITRISKWILYISSYIPLYFIFILSNCFDIYSTYININSQEDFGIYKLIKSAETNFFLLIIFILLIIFAFKFLCKLLSIASDGGGFRDFYNIKENNKQINEYVLVYIIPFITVKTNDFKELTIFGVLFILIGLISVKNDLVYVNPILYLMKYNIYNFKESSTAWNNSVLITKKTIIELKQLDSNRSKEKIRLDSKQISDNVYFIK